MFRPKDLPSLFILFIDSPHSLFLSLFFLSLSFSNHLLSLLLALTSVHVHQSGNPGIMNSQLSLAIPALPANTTLYEFAQLLARLFSEREREREKKLDKGRQEANEESYIEKENADAAHYICGNMICFVQRKRETH